ncbi:MAG TPA: response regulator transcription factor [Terriglobales bacterium]|nr:response regulator transcription factor [Terriglobales bacterium]
MPLVQLLTMSVLRTCSRCGKEFEGASGAYICDFCRKPRNVENDYSGKPLTAREKQVIALVRQALANKEIAWQLHLSEGTVKEYLSVIYKKLCIHNRTELALWAIVNECNAA